MNNWEAQERKIKNKKHKQQQQQQKQRPKPDNWLRGAREEKQNTKNDSKTNGINYGKN